MDVEALAELAIESNVFVEVRGPDGELKHYEEVHNVVTTAGKESIATLLKEGTTRVTHMAIGKKSEASETKLKEELDRNALTSTSVSGAVVTYVGEWAAGDGTGALKEAGTFTASSEGTMWMRATFSELNKEAEDTLKITWKLTVG